MSQQLLYIALFLLAVACLPFLTKWLVQRSAAGRSVQGGAKIVSVLAVGPSQRVVTVEAGPENDRMWLVLGVTSQQITCLHTARVFPVAVNQSAVDSQNSNE
jgi:flagellar protein FliO/FliZ